MLSETLEAIEDALDTVTFANADKKDDAKYAISQVIYFTYRVKYYCILMP